MEIQNFKRNGINKGIQRQNNPQPRETFLAVHIYCVKNILFSKIVIEVEVRLISNPFLLSTQMLEIVSKLRNLANHLPHQDLK